MRKKERRGGARLELWPKMAVRAAALDQSRHMHNNGHTVIRGRESTVYTNEICNDKSERYGRIPVSTAQQQYYESIKAQGRSLSRG
jgi:hypothetical protein